MGVYVLIPGAGGVAWFWSRVVRQLESAGHVAIAVDLPGDDDHAGLAEYAGLVVDAIGSRSDVNPNDVNLVAQSMGGFTAAMVCAAVDVRSLTFVNAMIPTPGETAGDWWDNTGAPQARETAAAEAGYGDFDEFTYFLHDVPADVVAESASHQRNESDAAFASKCEFDAWPPVPIRVAAGLDDRFFPFAFQRAVARDRLGVEVDALPGGHLLALSQPERLTDYLVTPVAH